MTFDFTSALRLAVLIAACTLTACSTITHKPVPAQSPAQSPTGPRNLAIFFDGTANDEKSDTNIKRLHSLVTLQDRPDIASLYVEGVGTGTDGLGMGLGVGTEARVKIAYEFILDNYRPRTCEPTGKCVEADRIFIFGFSRGAYAGRILASLLYHAGAVTGPVGKSSGQITEAVYEAVKDLRTPDQERERRSDVQRVLVGQGLQPSALVKVELLGLWDTVEALGYREGFSKLAHKFGLGEHEVDVDNANPRYGDKLCNVRQVRHAMSIDDNREWIFTPRLMTRGFLFDDCDPKHRSKLLNSSGNVISDRLKEVWFSGAHSDVGGGYQGSLLSGVSLNWMLGEIQRLQQKGRYQLVPPTARVLQDVHGTSHNPESGVFSPLYHAMNRSLAAYALDPESVPGYRGTLLVHESVFKRRQAAPPKNHEYRQLKLDKPGPVCLIENQRREPPNETRHRQRDDSPEEAHRFCRAYLEVVEVLTANSPP